MERRDILTIAAAIIIAAILNGGIYQAEPLHDAGGMVINRFTGSTWLCGRGNCHPQPEIEKE